MVALRPDEWNPICCSASRTVTRASADSTAAADRPAIPPPMTRISGLATRSGGGQPLVHDFAASRQPDSFDDLIVVGKRQPPLLLIPEGGEEIIEIAREQG